MKWTDDEIIGAILAGAEATGRRLQSWIGSFGEKYEPDGPCCAVGAGLLYRDVKIVDDAATRDFARQYGVSNVVAQGVSDGFEDFHRRASCTGYGLLSNRELHSEAYERGWAIGAAVRSAIEEDAT